MADLKIKQTTVLCYKDGNMLFDVTNDGFKEHPCCPTCEPTRYMTLLKNAVDIKILTPEEIRDSARNN